MNWYKIRANEQTENSNKTHEMMQNYSNHLEKIEKEVPKDLINYFGFDFFHDGTIEPIHFENNHNDILMKIWGPNIKFWKTEKEYEYINCKFNVVFTNVVIFEMKVEKYDKHNDPLHYGPNTVQYLYGEINSLSEDIAMYNKMYEEDDLRFHSLIFMANPCERWYKLVFSDVTVWAEEDLAFAIMRKDDRYEIPIYRAKSLSH